MLRIITLIILFSLATNTVPSNYLQRVFCLEKCVTNDADNHENDCSRNMTLLTETETETENENLIAAIVPHDFLAIWAFYFVGQQHAQKFCTNSLQTSLVTAPDFCVLHQIFRI